MSILDSLNKSVIVIAVGLVLVFSIQSCRKKIEHIPGSELGPEFPEWVKLSNGNFSGTVTLEVFNNELYLGGSTYNDLGKLVKMNTENQTSEFLSSPLYAAQGGVSFDDPVILDLYTANNKLYIAGNFSYNMNPDIATSFMTYDLNGDFEEIPLLTYNQSRIYNVGEYQGDLIVCGDFGTFNGPVTTANVERIQNGVPIGLEYLEANILESTEHNNELYVVGDNIHVKRWAGSTWANVPYLDELPDDKVFSICTYNSELYILGDFDAEIILKKLNSLGIWENVAEITGELYNYPSGGLKVLDGELFIVGNNINLNSTNTSNVVMFDGVEWSNIGRLNNFGINDIAKFNSKLYCASSTFLFEIAYP